MPEIEELKQELEKDLLRIKNISNFDGYIEMIDKKIDSLNAEKEEIDGKWNVNDLMFTDLNEIITNKMFIDEKDKEEKNKEFINLCVLWSEKEASKKKIDDRIAELEAQKESVKENVRLGIEALYLFMIDIEKDNYDFLNSIGLKKDPGDLQSKFSSNEKPDYYADKLGNISRYFKRIEYITKEKEKTEERLKELKLKWEPNRIRLEELCAKIRAKRAAYKSGVFRELDPEIDSLETEYLNLLIKQQEQKNEIDRISNKIAKLEIMNKKMITNVTEAIHTLSNILTAFEKSNGVSFSEDYTKEKLPRDFDGNFEVIELPEDAKEKIKVTIDLNNGSEPTVVEKDKGEVLEIYSPATMKEGYTFREWLVNGEPFDISKPVTEDITLVASYDKIKLCNVNLYDSNGKILKRMLVPFGERINGLDDDLIPKKKFKTFDGWEVMSEHEEINGAEYDLDSQVIGDLTLKATYKYNKKRILAVAAGVATAALATATDLVYSSTVAPTNGLFSQSTALLNGTLAVGSIVGLKNAKEPNYDKEIEVKGIKKAGVKLLNHFRNKENLRNWRDYLATSAVLSGISGVVQGIHGALTPDKEVLEGTTIFEPVVETPTEKVEVFNGIDPNQTIYKDPYLQFPNGKPNMQYFGDNGAVVRFIDSAGKEISNNTPITEIAEGPIKIIERQVDGTDVGMGMINDFATKLR